MSCNRQTPNLIYKTSLTGMISHKQIISYTALILNTFIVFVEPDY